MSPDLGAALVRANLATGLSPSEAMRKTNEALLAIHLQEMKAIDERYERITGKPGQSAEKPRELEAKKSLPKRRGFWE